MKVSENTNIGLPIKNLIAIIFFICTGLYAFFTIQERLNKLETADTLFQADLLKKAEQEPKNLEMYMLIEHLAGEIETIQKEIQESRYNKVNIDHLKEHLLMPSLSECMQRKRISMRSTNNAKFQCMKVNAVIKDGKIISISKSD